jgi:beta-phosphoglucomutase-like phosphatase (HAD superfamily)
MKLKIPQGDFHAYLFDCDGTIADSMPLHYVAWKQALAEWNCDLEERLFYEWGGWPVVKIISTLNQERELAMPVETVAHRKEGLYFELLPQLKAVPEVLEPIERSTAKFRLRSSLAARSIPLLPPLQPWIFSTASTLSFMPVITRKASRTLRVSC